MRLFTNLSNEELLAEVSRLATGERQATAALIRCLMEVDERELYLSEGYSSLFTFCTQALHLSEHAALGRTVVARAARRLPKLLAHLEDGSLTVTNARMLAPHMTGANYDELLAAARHRSKRAVEEIVARLRPQPDVSSVVRKLPAQRVVESPAVPPAAAPRVTTFDEPRVTRSDAPRPQTSDTAPTPPPPPRPVVAPLSPERYKIQFTASRDTHERLRYAQDLLRHVVPSGDIAIVFDHALCALIEQLEKQKCAATSRPRESSGGAGGSRHIPAAVRREVWRAMPDAARLSARADGAASGGSWSSTTWCRSRPAARQTRTTSSFAAVRTISTRRICSSGRIRSGSHTCCGADSVRPGPSSRPHAVPYFAFTSINIHLTHRSAQR